MLAVGAGYSRIPGFERVDIDPDVQPDHLCDAKELSKNMGEGVAAELRAHHILEHFYVREAFSVVRDWWKVLQPGGRLEIAVPDCGYAARAYADGRIDHGQYAKIILGGDQTATQWMLHKNVFTAERLQRLLFITGFVRVKDIRVNPDELRYEAFRPEE